MAATKIHDFLADLVSTKILKTKCFSTCFRLKRLADFCRENYSKNQEKKKALKSIWEREVLTLVSKFANKDTTEAKEKEQKLINFPSETVDVIICDYLDRCKLRHSNLYLRWRQHYIDKLQDVKSMLEFI